MSFYFVSMIKRSNWIIGIGIEINTRFVFEFLGVFWCEIRDLGWWSMHFLSKVSAFIAIFGCFWFWESAIFGEFWLSLEGLLNFHVLENWIFVDFTYLLIESFNFLGVSDFKYVISGEFSYFLIFFSCCLFLHVHLIEIFQVLRCF